MGVTRKKKRGEKDQGNKRRDGRWEEDAKRN